MSPHEIYLETQVMTATPQRLRLMLVEAAIRWARLTLDRWSANQQTEALESLERCRAIISELLAGVTEDGTVLVEKVAGIYVFLFTALTEAQHTRKATTVEAVIRVLEEERQTWLQLCEKLGESPTPGAAATPVEETAPARVTGDLLYRGQLSNGLHATSELSLDA